MLRMALLFLLIALLAGLFGFGIVADVTYGVARILFFIFLVMAAIALVGGLTRGVPPV
jgi:uncharacterized membrane protein YtjA (UPF0391 family)